MLDTREWSSNFTSGSPNSLALLAPFESRDRERHLPDTYHRTCRAELGGCHGPRRVAACARIRTSAHARNTVMVKQPGPCLPLLEFGHRGNVAAARRDSDSATRKRRRRGLGAPGRVADFRPWLVGGASGLRASLSAPGRDPDPRFPVTAIGTVRQRQGSSRGFVLSGSWAHSAP